MEILAEAVKMAFGPKEILKGIDFSLHNKEFVGIIGPNGSGKSTFSEMRLPCAEATDGKLPSTERRWTSFPTVNRHCSWR